MRSFSRRLIYAISNKIWGLRKNKQQDNPDNKLTADFSKSASPFDIKSESSFDAYLSGGSLALGLKKTNCISWVETPQPDYQDHYIEAKLRLDSLGGYAATGLLFRIMDENSYYIALVSSKGYFRFDIVKDNAPKTLIAWTEVSDFNGTNIDLNIVTCGTYIIFIVNGVWVGETSSDSISCGRLGFALASYPAGDENDAASGGAASETDAHSGNEYACKAMLDHFSVDPRTATVESKYKQWSDDSNINAGSRLRLAETYAVMGEYAKALDQINRAWKRRDDVIRSASVSYTTVRTAKELLLAARMSFSIGQYKEAEEYIDAVLEQWPDSAEWKPACTEKLRILNENGQFAELKEFVLTHADVIYKDVNYYTILGRCYWELKEYAPSAEAWKEAFRLNGENAVYAANAANALELTGKKDKALSLFLEAGKLFLKQDNLAELEVLSPKLSALGGKNWEARTLLGKWAFSIEDYDRCIKEFSAAERLRRAINPRPKGDPAAYYLWALVCSLKGNIKKSVSMLNKAVKLAPDFGLFRFKLAEIKLINGLAADQRQITEEFKIALNNIDDDQKIEMTYHAGNLLLNAGDGKNAKYFFDLAGSMAQEQ